MMMMILGAGDNMYYLYMGDHCHVGTADMGWGRGIGTRQGMYRSITTPSRYAGL